MSLKIFEGGLAGGESRLDCCCLFARRVSRFVSVRIGSINVATAAKDHVVGARETFDA